jgi:hypothetical protein
MRGIVETCVVLVWRNEEERAVHTRRALLTRGEERRAYRRL